MHVLVCHLLLPGSRQILRGRLWLGVPLLLAGLANLTAAALLGLLLEDTARGELLVISGAFQLLLIALAIGHWWLDVRQPPIDDVTARACYTACARAYLQGDTQGALAEARRLSRLAPKLPGAWQLLALIAEAQQDARLARCARKRAAQLRSG